MFANVHRPRPTTYMFEWFKSLQRKLENRVARRGGDRLFKRVCNECEHFLVLIEEEHDTEVPETFIGET